MPRTGHQFIPVWQPLDAEKTYRTKVYGPSRKRKRVSAQHDSDDDDEEEEEEDVYPQVSSSPATSAWDQRHLTDIDIEAYNIAGHSKSLPLPAHPFPHAAISVPRRHVSAETIQKSLAALKPPLYVPAPPEDEDAKTSLRRHHLGVMTTIMHTTLLRGDYVRAGRAWGMILRTEVFGRAVDVRTYERWGIGAEILLRKHTKNVVTSLLSENSYDDDASSSDEVVVGEEGFQLAKDYFERLILQYPYQKTHPNAISSLTFQPAMYGLCIYEIQQQHKQALKKAEQASRSPSPSFERDPSDDEHNKDSIPSLESRQAAVVKGTLAKAITLADRMAELMLSPPNDTYLPLLRLRAMLALWIADMVQIVVDNDEKVDPMYSYRLDKEKAIARKFVLEMDKKGEELPAFFTLND
ncbi:hypothetical protein AAFC00_007179 [Neodothiora populina]|uniref:Uncharacterized protein n=1 Tax=Neodothiora populina TaxID=2781224 RepID=A0ABR3PHT0_9PEZI